MNDRDVALDLIAKQYRDSQSEDGRSDRAHVEDSYRFARDVLDGLERRGLMVATVPVPWVGWLNPTIDRPALDDAP